MSKETKLGGLQSSNEAAISGRADVCKPQVRSSGLSEAVLLPHSLVLFCVPTSWCKACEFREVAWLLISTHERRAASSRACSCGFGARKVLLRLETTLARSKTSYRLEGVRPRTAPRNALYRPVPPLRYGVRPFLVEGRYSNYRPSYRPCYRPSYRPFRTPIQNRTAPVMPVQSEKT
jgi:hypothetical protein